MTEGVDSGMSFRTRFVCGGCWPALVAALLASAYLFFQMRESGYFGNSMYEGESGEWMVIIFPIMAGVIVGASALVLNAILLLAVRPQSKRNAFFIGVAALPVAVLAGIGIKCLL